MDQEIREYFESLHSAIASLRDEMASMRDDLRGDITSVRGDMIGGFAAVDAKIAWTGTDLRRQFEVTAEGLRHQMQIMAEGVVMNAEALSRFRAEFIAEIHALRRGR